MARHNELGRLGEEKAADYLQQKGYIILDRNWHLKHRDMLVIVEVKTRNTPEERPGELLDFRKCRNLRRAADAYVKAKGIGMEVRFDLIVLTGQSLEIEHIQEVIQIFE